MKSSRRVQRMFLYATTAHHARRGRLRATVLGIVLCLGGAAHAQSGPAPAVNPFADNPQAARNGEELFGRSCQLCHNSRAKGGKAPQLVRGAWGPGGANSDAYMFQVISNGRPGTAMGAFGPSLSEADIWQIVSFLRAESLRVKAAELKATDNDHLW